MRLIHRPLLIFVLHVVNHPRRILTISLLVLAICVGAAKRKLNISTEQNKLFDPNVQFFRDFRSFNQKFPETEATYVLIEPTDPAHPGPIVACRRIQHGLTAGDLYTATLPSFREAPIACEATTQGTGMSNAIQIEAHYDAGRRPRLHAACFGGGEARSAFPEK